MQMRLTGAAESVALCVLSVGCLAAAVGWSPPAQLMSTLGPGELPQGYCPSGETPAFTAGFATLKAQLGVLMGEPVECPHAVTTGPLPSVAGAPGLIRQATTTGVAVYLPDENIPTFEAAFEHWAIVDEGLVYWSFQSETPPPRREPGTLLFQASWSSDPTERATAGSAGWKTSAGMLINHGYSGAVDSSEVAPTLGRASAVEAQLQADPNVGGFGIWRQRMRGTYRLAYTDGKLLIASDETAAGFAPANLLVARALASVDFAPGTDWHTYRFEATRTHFRGLVDGELRLEVEDDRYPGETGNGVWTDAAPVTVRDYRLLEL